MSASSELHPQRDARPQPAGAGDLPRMDVFVAGMSRGGTTLLANLMTTPPGQWLITEPGITRGDMGEHVRQQALRFGIEIDEREWRAGGAGESARQRFERVLAPRLAGCRWGVKEVNIAGWDELIRRYRPRRIVVAVRDIRDCALSILEKHERQTIGRRDFLWMYERLLDTSRALVKLTRETPAEQLRVVRYEDFVRDPQQRNALSAWLGWSLDGDPSRCLDLFGRESEISRHAGEITPGSVSRAAHEQRPDWLAFADQLVHDAGEYQAFFGYPTRAAESAVSQQPQGGLGRRHRERLLSLLKTGTRVLAWGASEPTAWLARQLPPGAALTCIEHDAQAHRRALQDFGANPQVRLLLREPTGPLGAGATIDEEDEAPLQPFVHAVDGEQFDLVWVDGKARGGCLRAAEKLLAPGGTVVLHDAQRAWYDQAKTRFVAHGHLGSCADAPSAHLWWGGAGEPQPEPAGQGDLPVIVSYYTQDTEYEVEARRLIASCERLGLEHRIVGVPTRGSWEANCNLKAQIVHQVWQETGKPVLWVDADAVMHAAPELLRGTSADFAIRRCRGWEFLSGTCFFNQSLPARRLLERWLARCQRFPRVWDQHNLDLAWEDVASTQPLQTLWLPESYCRIFDLHEERSPGAAVVEHFQASRRLKDKVSRTSTQPRVPPMAPRPEFLDARRATRPRAWMLAPADGVSAARPRPECGLTAVVASLRGVQPAPARVLLLAGGQGVLWRLLCEAGYEPHTLHDNAEQLADALAFAPGRARLGSVTRTLLADDAFDAACCHGLLEFLPDAQVDAALAELRRVVRGTVVIAVNPNPDHEPRWPESSPRDAAWWQARFQAAGFTPAAPPSTSGSTSNLAFVRAAPARPAAAALDGLAAEIDRALRAVFDPARAVIAWGSAEALANAGTDRLPWRLQPVTASAWTLPAAGTPAAGEAWRQVLLVAEGELPSAEVLRRTMLQLWDQGAERLLVVACPAPAQAVAARHALEAQAFAIGFRKSPAYYAVAAYEALHQERGPVLIALERVPDAASRSFPLQALSAERDLHMDMLREVGERSDAHVVRYQLAAQLIRPGDAVLDAACGLGYGSYVLARQSRCASVLGVDGSDYAVRYAELSFAAVERRLRFAKAWLPAGLAELPDQSFDVIVCIETLQHVEDPDGLLACFDRLLKPGGRIIASVPNDWSDDSGKAANPNHLQLYTLASLRTQFERHFDAQTLHLQIASGCKSSRHGRRWTRMPRALRAVPVDTSAAPDAEWWIVAGRKRAAAALPAARPQTQPQAQAQPVPGSELARGLVLAVNCTPPEADPAVPAFWSALSAELAASGWQLVVASTVALEDPALQVIQIPYLLTEFQPPREASGPPPLPSAATVAEVQRWYGCTADEAVAGLANAGEFFADLLDTLRPAAVLGWQSANPVTRVLRRCARDADLPFWSGERGWVRNTLMFDLGDNNALGEAQLGLAAATLRERLAPSPATLALLSRRARDAADLGRYAAAERVDGAALRERLGIPADARVVAFFGHGEPSFALHGGAAGALHELSEGQLKQRLDAVTDELLARGCWLLVQEHPFNRDNGRTLRLKESPRVIALAENVSSVLDAADASLFTLATLQFDAAFLDKPLGLLSRSALYRAGEPPMFGDYADAGAFLDAALDAQAWPRRAERLRRDIGFLYENFLLDIEPAQRRDSAARWARHLTQRARPVDDGMDARIGAFLQKWA